MTYKICVYAIAKDEEKFVNRFVDAAAEADDICVLDTGSTDRTVELLTARGVTVERAEIQPWRFDAARNRSLRLIPADTDICVCADLDEVLSPGWREALERAWQPDTEQARYTCVCSRNPDGTPGTAFLRDKIHKPGLFAWRYPVHEVLVRADGKPAWPAVDVPDMLAEHLPDEGKSRGAYLPLLQRAVEENPTSARCRHYLGREYMYHGKYETAIAELRVYLGNPGATWAEERSASMRYIAECHLMRGRPEEAVRWALRCAAEAPALRESWYAAEKAAYYAGDWQGVIYYGERAAAIETRSKTCINEAEAWSAEVNDLLSIAYWNTGLCARAIEAAERALVTEPDNARIRENLALYERARKEAAT
jgi:glycosyltransferase involved in cell wall biosynthesis